MKYITKLLTAAITILLLTACQQADSTPQTEDLNRLLDRTAAVSSGDIVILLQAGELLTAKEPVVVPDGKKLIIKGIEGAPAKITLGENGLVVGNSLEIENVNIEASTVTTPLITMSTEPGGDLIADYCHVETIRLKNVSVWNMEHSLLFDDKMQYCVDSLTLDKAVISLKGEAGQRDDLLFFRQGGVQELIINNSVIYGSHGVAKYFVRYNDKGGHCNGIKIIYGQ